VTTGTGIKRTSWFVLCGFVFSLSAVRSTPELTLDDLKKLEIICFVPSHLPEGFRLQRVDITYDELHEEFDHTKHQLPLYSIVYSNDPRRGATFSIESAREGIGDRNIMVEEDTEETGDPNTSRPDVSFAHREGRPTGQCRTRRPRCKGRDHQRKGKYPGRLCAAPSGGDSEILNEGIGSKLWEAGRKLKKLRIRR
jgi:hypothetical protein